MKRITITLLLLLTLTTIAMAQQGLAINQAFSNYSYLPESREVKLSGKSVAKYHLSLFHSLDISNPSAQQVAAVCEMLRKDTETTLTAETRQHHDGSLQSGFYSLPVQNKQKRYIFYKHTQGKLSLIYIEGKATLKEMKKRFSH